MPTPPDGADFLLIRSPPTVTFSTISTGLRQGPSSGFSGDLGRSGENCCVTGDPVSLSCLRTLQLVAL